MRTLIVCGLILVFLASFGNLVSAFDEAILEVEVTAFDNYFREEAGGEMPDMSDSIFVGNDEGPFGEEEVDIPLTEEGIAIDDELSDIDDLNEISDNVPGLHIARGEDENGRYFVITASSANVNLGTREAVFFNIELNNAIISSIMNGDNSEEENIFENPTDGSCAVMIGDLENSASHDDEYTIEIGGNEGDFCSMTGHGRDRVKIYYQYTDMTAPKISNIESNPSLPLTNDGNSQDIQINFESSEFPIHVSFNLLDENGQSVDAQEDILVENANPLPIVYNLPSGLSEGDYELKLIAGDEAGNSAVYSVGDILVNLPNGDDDDDDNSGGDDDDDDNINDNIGKNKKKGAKTVESINLVEEEAVLPAFLEEENDSIKLTEDKKASVGLNILMLIWILGILIVVSLLLIVIQLAR